MSAMRHPVYIRLSATPDTQHFRRHLIAQRIRRIHRIPMNTVMLGQQITSLGIHLQHFSTQVALTSLALNKHHFNSTH